MAKISIIIPVYNVEKYLQQCIDSLLSQTLSDIEIICIDDASQDASGKILNDYAARDDRMVLKVLHRQILQDSHHYLQTLHTDQPHL